MNHFCIAKIANRYFLSQYFFSSCSLSDCCRKSKSCSLEIGIFHVCIYGNPVKPPKMFSEESCQVFAVSCSTLHLQWDNSFEIWQILGKSGQEIEDAVTFIYTRKVQINQNIEQAAHFLHKRVDTWWSFHKLGKSNLLWIMKPIFLVYFCDFSSKVPWNQLIVYNM